MTNERQDQEHGQDGLGRLYRQVADEQTPASLDRAVIDVARRDVTRRSKTAWRYSWYRPVAFAATIVLAVALVLELTQSTTIDAPFEDAPSLPRDVFEVEGNRTASEIERLGTGMSTPSPEPGAMDATAVSGEPTNSTQVPADDQCSTEDRETASRWWACIESLEQRGLTAAAERELQALLRTHPTFRQPQ